MKYLLLTILLLSCSGRSTIKVEPVIEPAVIQDTAQPSFILAMPFEGGSDVEPVESIPVWTPVVCTTFKSYVPSRKDTASCIKTILGVDTVVCIDTVFACTLWCASPPEIVHSRGLAYLMLWIGFVCGILFVLVVNLVLNRKKKTSSVKKMSIISNYKK